jgi:hypothetical protein
MTTIQHPSSRAPFWWYLAAAVATAAVLTLLFAALHQVTGGERDTAPPATTVSSHTDTSPYGSACFGMRHTDAVDLARAGCAAGMH